MIHGGKAAVNIERKIKVKKKRLLQCIPVIALGMFVAFFCLTEKSVQPEPESSNIVFAYEITPDSPEWKCLSVAQKIAACRISKEVLENMTEEQLLEAVMDFPFRLEIFYYSSREEGVRNLVKISDAYVELLGRENAKSTVQDALNDRTSEKEMLTAGEEIECEILDAMLLYHEEAVEEAEKLAESSK